MSFSGDLEAFRAKVLARYQLVIRKIALDAFSEVVLMTPVITGRARGNWQVAIGEVPEGTIEIDDKTGTVTISKIRAVTEGLVGGQDVVLANNLPYISALEYGSSQQAPGGMVRLTAQRFQPIADKAVAAVLRTRP